MRALPALHSIILAGIVAGRLSGQAFDCVILGEENTNLFTPPDSCPVDPLVADWCNCVRSAFTSPVRGSRSGFQQAVIWIVGDAGIGNHRVEVSAGSLDFTGLAPGSLLGEVIADELIPGSFPIVGGELFTFHIEIRATAVSADSIDFKISVTETTKGVQLALGYDPPDEEHSLGHLYSGRLTKGPQGQGFTIEYRYATDLYQEDPRRRPGVEANEITTPTFTIPLLFKFFSKAPGLYTLPDAEKVSVTTTLRRFTETALDEVLPLGEADLCRVVVDPSPCKTIEETFDLPSSPAPNNPPRAVINVLDGGTLTVLPEPRELYTFCGRSRLLLRGRNSSDGDGEIQPLAFQWLLKSGPEGGAEIPAHTRTFKDTQVFFSKEGDYEIALRVNDGGTVNNTDEASFTVSVLSIGDENVPPTAVVATRPDPPLVDLRAASPKVTLDGTLSSNGLPGEDDCRQRLSFAWAQVEGPPGAEAKIQAPNASVTDVTFTSAGDYTFELTVDDGAAEDHSATARVTVMVVGGVADPRLRRGDSDTDARVNLTDAVRTLNFLFQGAAELPCLDAADADDSGIVNITDPILTLNFLFLGGLAPKPPGPFDCGPDPSPDELAPCTYTCAANAAPPGR